MTYYVILLPLVGVQRSYKAASPYLASSNSTPADFFHGAIAAAVDHFLNAAGDAFLDATADAFFICCC